MLHQRMKHWKGAERWKLVRHVTEVSGGGCEWKTAWPRMTSAFGLPRISSILASRWEVFEELMGYVGQHELMQSCHPVLIAYLHLLASLAGDEQGAEEVMNQLQQQVCHPRCYMIELLPTCHDAGLQ